MHSAIQMKRAHTSIMVGEVNPLLLGIKPPGILCDGQTY